MTEPIRISVEQGKEAFSKSGIKPVRRVTLWENSEKQKCGCLLTALAIQDGCPMDRAAIMGWLPSLGTNYAAGIMDGFDDRPFDRWHMAKVARYREGYEDGKAIGEAVLGTAPCR